MKAIGNYLWNLMIFLITPILVILMECLGVQVPYSSSVNREYSRSVHQRINVVFILYITVIGLLLISQIVTYAVIVTVPLSLACIAMLTPQVLLSYETWNWWKIASLQRRLRKYKSVSYEKGEKATLIKNFLEKEAMIADLYGYHHWERFNHLLHLFRTLEYWKGTRKELLERCGIDTFHVED